MLKKISTFLDKVSVLIKGGGDEKIAKRRQNGVLTARERIYELLDQNSFHEIDLFVEHSGKDFGLDKQQLAGDGVVTGFGKIDGRQVAVYAQDFTVQGGSLGKMHAAKITKTMDMASEMGMPIIGINDSGGARIQEGVDSLAGYGEIFLRNTLNSGKIPQISVILGPCAGGAVYSPAITDFVFMVDKLSKMFVTGPKVIESVLSEKVSSEELGGAKVHNTKTGNAHFYSQSELDTFTQVRTLLSYLPSAWDAEIPKAKPAPPKSRFKLADTIPDDSRKSYDIIDVIKTIVDGSEFFEVQAMFAKNVVIGFARLDGEAIGIIANQPKVKAGCLDVDSSDKAARFVRFCDAFCIPILTLVDLPGYLPGADQEHAGIIRHGAKMIYAYAEATVPKVSLILRKAFGGGYIAMSSKHLKTDFVYALPSAEIAVMGPESACNIIFAKEIRDAENPEALRQQKINEYREKFSNPYNPASKGYIDAIIHPDETRQKLIQSFEIARKKKPVFKKHKHGCIPL
ncbi:acyl-CoA carboxylase subunit beta [bacterium]|nr:acyl-CoA carboxylase subunit beta [bacterium]